MKKKLFARSVIIAFVAALFLFSNTAFAYWVWTPGTKKFVNPKNAAKDTPKEQFEWAMNFYNAKDYQKAITEFEKLTKQYEYSEYASRAQYYVGLSYENLNKFYIAFQNYQKAIDNFPHIENMDEIVAREFNIANMFVTKESPKVLGTDIMTSLDRAIEIYKKVVDNAPYGKLADEAQFRMAQAFKKADRYDEAIPAFQKILDDYPASTFVDKAKFEVADCAYKASLKPAYDVEPTTKAIKAFEDFSRENRDRSLTKEADKTIQRLRDRAAEKSLMTAQFYEKIGRYQAAIIYYKDVITTYPDSSFVDLSRSKVEALTTRLQQPNAKAFSFNFTKPAVKKTEKPVEAVVSEEKPKKKAWAPLSFAKQAKPKETVAETEKVAEPKTSKFKPWNLFAFKLNRSPKAEETVAKADKASEPKISKVKLWNPFASNKTSKPKEEIVEPAVLAEKPAKKAWAPLNFTTTAKPKETTTEVQKSSEPKASKVKLWNPFASNKSSKSNEAVIKTEKTSNSKNSKFKPWNLLAFKLDRSPKTEKPAAEQLAPVAPAQDAVKAADPKTATVTAESVSITEANKTAETALTTENTASQEKPSEISVTTNEAEVKTAQDAAAEAAAVARQKKEEEDDTENQIDKSEY
jgi:outer membrane assembly lipoprotein YfiO